jgi:hypothetical protein
MKNLGCDAMEVGRSSLTFHRNTLPPSWGSNWWVRSRWKAELFLPNFCNQQTVISITGSSAESSGNKCTWMWSPVYPTVISLDSEGLWWWCITHRFTGILDFVHCLYYKKLENTTFRKAEQFPSSGEGGETPGLLGPLERGNLSHRFL